MSERLIFIGILYVMGLVFCYYIKGAFLYEKRISVEKSLMEEAVNEQINTEKLGFLTHENSQEGNLYLFGSFNIFTLYFYNIYNNWTFGKGVCL